jgi:transcriptional regulator with XRE-family HTH domain
MGSYDRFETLCKARGITVSGAMIAAGLSKALATKWKGTPNYTPNADTIAKLCRFFNVSADYFLGSGNVEPYKTFNEIPEVNILLKAMGNMTEEQRREVYHYAKYIAPNSFDL